MKPLARLILRLYPSVWRDRYQAELETLLDDAGLHPRFIPGLFQEALKMRLTTFNWRYAGAFALAGLAIAILFSMRLPDHYISNGYARIEAASEADRKALLSDFATVVDRVLSRTSLAHLVQDPGLDLYHDERRREPLEDVLARMKSKDLQISYDADGAVHISYRALTPYAAQRTVQLILTRLIDEGFQSARARAVRGIAVPRGSVRVENPPSLPETPIPPNRFLIAGAGLLTGLFAAASLATIRRSPRTWLLAGSVAAVLAGLSWYVPLFPYQSTAVMIFDSSATLESLTSDGPQIRKWLKKPPEYRIATERHSVIPERLTIRVNHVDRRQAQAGAQSLISGMAAMLQTRRAGLSAEQWPRSGPWLEVLDPPSYPVNRVGESLREAVLLMGLAIVVTAALGLFLNRRVRPNSAPQHA